MQFRRIFHWNAIEFFGFVKYIQGSTLSHISNNTHALAHAPQECSYLWLSIRLYINAKIVVCFEKIVGEMWWNKRQEVDELWFQTERCFSKTLPPFGTTTLLFVLYITVFFFFVFSVYNFKSLSCTRVISAIQRTTPKRVWCGGGGGYYMDFADSVSFWVSPFCWFCSVKTDICMKRLPDVVIIKTYGRRQDVALIKHIKHSVAGKSMTIDSRRMWKILFLFRNCRFIVFCCVDKCRRLATECTLFWRQSLETSLFEATLKREIRRDEYAKCEFKVTLSVYWLCIEQALFREVDREQRLLDCKQWKNGG